ncbi:MAG: hypothetical protein K2H85_11800 [Allobaculum sp.]|nr:hypothetical protein [Allobaculum sp.]
MNALPKPRDIRIHLERCIQSVVKNRQGYILDPTHQMTRTRKLPFKTCLEIILGRSAMDNRNKAIFFKRVIFLLTGLYVDRELKSFLKPFIDKLFPLPFESMFKRYRGYRF